MTFIKQWASKHPQLVSGLGWSLVLVLLLGTSTAFAAQDIGSVAKQVTGTFGALAKLITAAAYVAGLGFAVGAVLKFKQHKDNPTQIPIGTPIALIFIAAALIFLPSIFGITGQTLFGGGGEVGGAYGVVFTGQ
jgi:intracellular multiplication protein IcmD